MDAGTNRQSTLNNYMGIGEGVGYTHGGAPRKRQAYESKRLQEVVSEYRKKRKAQGSVPQDEADWEDEQEVVPKPKPKKRKAAVKEKKKVSKRGRGHGRGKGSGRLSAAATDEDEDGNGDDEAYAGGMVDDVQPEPPALRPRPKPKPISRPVLADDDHNTEH